MIKFEDFEKVEMKVGEILSAEKVPDTEKLLKLSVDFGFKEIVMQENTDKMSENSPQENFQTKKEKDVRQIVSGIALYFPEPQTLIGRHVVFVTNIEPRKIKGLESNGMILATKTETAFSLLEVPKDISPGAKIG